MPIEFKSLPVALLGAAAGLSLLTGGVVDALLIAGVVVANAFIGYQTESEAERTIRSLQTLVRPTAWWCGTASAGKSRPPK